MNLKTHIKYSPESCSFFGEASHARIAVYQNHCGDPVANCPCDGCTWRQCCKVECANFKHWVITGKCLPDSQPPQDRSMRLYRSTIDRG